MPFTHVWNSTTPLDTELANLLGQNLRDLKLDISERLGAFAAGTIANRPTPEAAFAGVMYFATDEGKLYRWSGTAWVLVFCRHLLTDTTLRSTPSAIQVQLTHLDIPANYLTTGMRVRYKAHFYYGAGTVTSATTLLLYVSGTQLGAWSSASGANIYDADVTFEGIVSGPTTMSWIVKIKMVQSGSEDVLAFSSLTSSTALVLDLTNPIIIETQGFIANGGTIKSDFSTLEFSIG